MRRGMRPSPESATLGSDPRVLLVHIPKTAGISLVSALEAWAGHDRSLRFPNGGVDFPAWRDLPAARLSQLRLISGHLAWPLFRRRDLGGWAPITLIREPLARTLSVYTFVRQTKAHPWYEQVSRMDLDTFLGWLAERPPNLDQQTRFLTDSGDPDAAFAVLGDELTLAASLEHLEEFAAELSSLIGHRIALRHQNRSRERIDPTRLPASTQAALRALNERDLQLYARVRDAGLLGTRRPCVAAPSGMDIARDRAAAVPSPPRPSDVPR